MDTALEKLIRKYGVIYRGKSTKWTIEVKSAVRTHSRHKLSDYYLIVENDGVFRERFHIRDEKVARVTGNTLPKYIVSLCEDLMATGDVNKYLLGDPVDNKFTQIGRRTVEDRAQENAS